MLHKDTNNIVLGIHSHQCIQIYGLWMGTWWRHQMETFSALLALCAGNSPVSGEFPWQRPVTRNFDDFFNLRLNKRLSKQSRRWWFETPSCSLWRHCNVTFRITQWQQYDYSCSLLQNRDVWGETVKYSYKLEMHEHLTSIWYSALFC